MPKIYKVYPRYLKYTPDTQNMPKILKIYPGYSKYAQNTQNIHRVPKDTLKRPNIIVRSDLVKIVKTPKGGLYET